MNNKWVLATGVVLFHMGAPAVQANPKFPVTVGPQIGYMVIEGDSDVESDLVYGARFGTFLTKDLAAELVVLGGKSDIENTNKSADLLLPHVELQKHYGNSVWTPYLAAGLGYLQVNRDRQINENEIDFSVLYGAGLKWQFHPSFQARLDGRHFIDAESGQGTHNGLFTLGISWVYGNDVRAKKEIPPPPPPVVQVVDSDQDGVLDEIDRCPGTPLQTKVDERGCTLLFDTDGDGVNDDLDECPGTALGTVVDGVGCPQAEFRVPEKEWVLHGVRFQSGSDKLTPDSIKGLEEVVGILSTHARVRVEIQGHTDRTGSFELNQQLSEARAISVKWYLVGRGIEPGRMETVGFGYSKPIADNKTAANRAKNRRIEFRVLSR
ncbi:MAG: Outer membrane porin F [Elusimicrobia bacterium]|nr:Outer membrane porin F [Elusimicrobiota bacterium]